MNLWQNFPIPPDLAIEVVSETDAMQAVHEKAFEYLNAMAHSWFGQLNLSLKR